VRLTIIWSDWGLRYKVTRSRMCEQTVEIGELVIGPVWLEWDEWV